jgi:6,7-dimethyl-8-ribityllumazine synthase
MHGPNDGLSNVKVDGSGMRFGILCATFNFDIVDALRIGAVQGFTNHGVATKDIYTIWVPGAFELPVAALALAKSGKVDAVVALGAVIRGDTPHFEYVSGEAASGLQQAALQSGIHVAFGVLTVNTLQQALGRCSTEGNKGEEAAIGAIMTVQALKEIAAL